MDVLMPDLLRFSLMPGSSLMVLRDRKPMPDGARFGDRTPKENPALGWAEPLAGLDKLETN